MLYLILKKGGIKQMKQIFEIIRNKKWVKCKKCNEEWTEESLVNQICPRCRGQLPKQVNSEAMEFIMGEFNKLEQMGLTPQEIIIKINELIKTHNLMDKSKLLQCSMCKSYDLTMVVYEGKFLCDMCYDILVKHKS